MSERKSSSTKSKSKKKGKRKKAEIAPKRPANAFIKFCNANRSKIKLEMPSLTTFQMGMFCLEHIPDVLAIAGELGNRWKELSTAEKEPYVQEAKADTERYRREMEEHKAGYYIAPKPKAKKQKTSTTDLVFVWTAKDWKEAKLKDISFKSDFFHFNNHKWHLFAFFSNVGENELSCYLCADSDQSISVNYTISLTHSTRPILSFSQSEKFTDMANTYGHYDWLPFNTVQKYAEGQDDSLTFKVYMSVRGEEDKKEEKKEEDKKEEKKMKTRWTCATCTYENDGKSTKCSMCAAVPGEVKSHSHSDSSSSSSSSSSASSSSASKECSICMSSTINTALNCGHVYCKDCAAKMTECAQCRIRIIQRIPLFGI